jgi:AraC-like DNA-binding protein
MMYAQTQHHWDGQAMPLPNRSRLTSRDIGEVHNHMTRMFCPHDLYIKGGTPPIDFRHHQASLRSVSFNATDYGNPFGKVVIDIPPPETICLVQYSLCGVAEITQGKNSFELHPGHLCVLDHEDRVRQVFGEGYKHFTVKLPKSGLETVLAQELGFRPGPLHFEKGPVAVKGAAVAFTRLVRTICDDLDDDASAFAHARSSLAVEEALYRLLLAAVPHNHSDLFDTPAGAPSPYYVRRVEAYIQDHLQDPITMQDMIDVSGVSARSLHAGFRRFRGTTPMNFLKNRRLLLAHQQLGTAAGSGVSVTDVALACGFTHLSKFARDYQERFGERPSETLRRMGRAA